MTILIIVLLLLFPFFASGDVSLPPPSDEVYGGGWNGVVGIAPSKNAVYDKIETLGGGHDAVTLGTDADVLLGLSTQQLTLDSQSANLIFAGPGSGAAADPTFRALVDDDVPDTITLTNLSQITTKSHTLLSDIGTNAHSVIDTFIASKASASGLASLDASSLVVQNPANATATPTASKIPIADGSAKLDGWITLGAAIDISGETNLSGDTENVLTGDALSIGATITRDTEWDTEGEVQTAWGGVNILLATEIDTSAELAAINGDETGTGAAVFGTSPTLATIIETGKTDRNNVAVDDDDCTGEQGLYWYDTTDSAFEYCNANSGAPAVLGGGSGAPTTADYLVGTADAGLSAEIVVGTTPGGELGGTWASPTIDDSVTVTGWVMGASTATTPAADDNDTSLATTAYTQTELNAAGGRSISCASGSCDADPETYTDTKCIYFENPVATDDFKSIWYAKNAATITSIWAESDQTVTFMLQVDDGSPADVDSVDLAPAAGTAEDTSLDGDATLAAGDRLDLATTSVSGTPTWCSICWTFTRDD